LLKRFNHFAQLLTVVSLLLGLLQKPAASAKAAISLKRQSAPQPLLSKETKASSTTRKPRLSSARQSTRVVKRNADIDTPASAVQAAVAPSSQCDDAAVLKDSASGNIVQQAEGDSAQPVKKRSSRLKAAAPAETAASTLINADAATATAANAAETSTAVAAVASDAEAVEPVCPYPDHENVKWHCAKCNEVHSMTDRKALAPFRKKHGFKVSFALLPQRIDHRVEIVCAGCKTSCVPLT
jgi:hypothetical protein